MNTEKITTNISNRDKIKLVMAKDWWETEDLDGKIGKVKVSDGPVGLRCLAVTDSWANDSIYPSVAYPCYQMLSQTWNLELARKMGRAIADDCIDHNVDVLLGPGVNIKRTPLCGRNFEYYSEDPVVSGVMGSAAVKGIQSQNVSASLKHFAFNNKETNRKDSNSRVSERAAREIYLKPFEIVVKDAKPWYVMSAYNLVNECRTSECRELLTDILRGEWGFDGMVSTDWHTFSEQYKEIKAGNDLRMPTGFPERLMEAMEKGLITRQEIQRSAKRVLELILHLE